MKRKILYAFVISIGVFARLFELGKRSLWSDELEHLYAAQASFGDMWERLKIQLTPPFDYFVTHLILKLEPLWPFSFESLVRLPAVLASILALILILRQTKNPIVWLGAMGSAFLVVYAQECRPYSLVFLLSLLSFKFWTEKRWKAWTLVNSIGVATHYFFPLLIAAQLVHGAYTRQSSWRIVVRGLALQIIVWLLISPLFFEQLTQVAHNTSYRYGHVSGVTFLPSILSEFLWPFSPSILPGLIFLLFVTVGVILNFRKDPLLVFWAIVPLGLAWVISQFAEIATTKNMIIVFYPCVALAAAVFEKWGKIRPLVCVAIAVTSAYPLWHYSRKIEKEDYRGAAKIIAQKVPTGVIVMEQEYGFGPVYLARAGVDQDRFVDFWLPQWSWEPRRKVLLNTFDIVRPGAFISRQLDPALEGALAQVAQFKLRKELAGLTVYYDPIPYSPPQKLTPGVRELKIERSPKGVEYRVLSICCAKRGEMNVKPLPTDGLIPRAFWPEHPFPYLGIVSNR